MNISDWIGSIGVLLILIAYFLNINNKITNTDLSFILLNLIGAGMACLASVMINYIPFIILEAIWGIVSLVALMKYKRI